MKRVLRKAGERLAGLFVPKVDAGACVPNHGECCTRSGYSHNCYGICVKSSVC